ncbi:MAG: amidohydrolase family protein [Coriobacteriales bacterium]
MLLFARYVIPVSSPHIENGAILVRGNQIVDLGDANTLRAKYPDEEFKDFGIAALMPGFVDTHTHLEYSALRGLLYDVPYAAWKMQLTKKAQRFTYRDWLDSALLGAIEAVRSGITTISDVTSTGASFHAAKEMGLRGIIYREVGTNERAEIPYVLQSAYRDIDSWRADADPEMIEIGIAPYSLYTCHPEVFKELADYASDGTPLAIHLASSQEEYDFVKMGKPVFSLYEDPADRNFEAHQPSWLATGVSPVQYILNWKLLDVPNVLAIHCTHVDDRDIETLASHDVAISVFPRCNSKLGMGRAPILRFLQAGIRVGIGTDSPAASDVTDPIDEMRIALLLQRAASSSGHGVKEFLRTSQVLRLATLDGARALKIDDKVGSLEPGKLADIIAIDLSNSHQVPTHDPSSAIVHTANQENILMTMINGKVVYAGEDLHGVEVQRVFDRVEEMRVKLRS